MKLRHQLYLLQIVLAIVLFTTLGINYYTYQKQYQKDIDSYVQSEIKLHKKEILASIDKANSGFDTQKDLFYEVHKEALRIVKENINIDLKELQNQLTSTFTLQNIKTEIYLIDKSYTIYKTTFPKDLGFDLSVIADAKYALDKTTADGKIHISDFTSTDALSMKYKLYSYSKLTDDKYLELGFVDHKINNTAMSTITQNTFSNNKINIFNVVKINNGYSYYNMKNNGDIQKKDVFFKSMKTISKNNIKNNPIINTALSYETLLEMDGNMQVVIAPIFENRPYDKLGFENIVMKLSIDLTDQLNFLQKTKETFIISITITTLLLSIAFFFTKQRFTNPIEKIANAITLHQKVDDKKITSSNNELSDISNKYNNLFDNLNKEIVLNETLLKDNKQFIANTVHQIRTPLSNIMMNAEMVKKHQQDDTLSDFMDQIDASVNMLSNSYEDLAYITTYNSLEYRPTRVNASNMLHNRIKFFSTISKVNFKEITADIQNEIWININSMELERLIDNNISNGIKYATPKLPITITLNKKGIDNSAILEFKTFGKPIRDITKVFEENYRENDAKRGLGLGLNMVKGICEKYDIAYSTTHKDEQNIFTYIFKLNL